MGMANQRDRNQRADHAPYHHLGGQPRRQWPRRRHQGSRGGDAGGLCQHRPYRAWPMRRVLKRERGFTLLELLIAVAIFALLALATYRMLSSVMQADKATREHEQQLRELVRAMAAFE